MPRRRCPVQLVGGKFDDLKLLIGMINADGRYTNDYLYHKTREQNKSQSGVPEHDCRLIDESNGWLAG